MSETENDDQPSDADLADIQGNVVGFNKDHVRFLFATFPSQEAGRTFMAGMADEVNYAAEVLDFNQAYKTLTQRHEDPTSLEASWVNLLLSFPGLQVLGADGLDAFPDDFKQGMRARAPIVGDVDASDPSNWVSPFGAGSGFATHAVIIIAADSGALLDERTGKVRQLIHTAGVTEFTSTWDGQTRPSPFTGHEHFGFKDGISQPSIAGITRSSKGGDDIAPGEFLIGYEDQDGHISGQPPATAPVPQPGQPGYPPAPQPTPPQPLPAWCKNSAFGVLRRLRQDVGGFRNFLAGANGSGLTADQLAAKLVGRWPSGAPLETVPGDEGADTTTTDPGPALSEVLEDAHINDFGYHEHDQDGHLTPKAAHIRKTYPRDSEPPGREESNRHRILRRGIPYGPEFVETEPPYGTGPIPDTQDRGLLFLCYQASITDGFEFIQSRWVNVPDFPDAGDGDDPIISQNTASPPFTLPPSVHLTTQRWVITTGGEYLFSPSITAIRHLGSLT